jgi:hypothetical protein
MTAAPSTTLPLDESQVIPPSRLLPAVEVRRTEPREVSEVRKILSENISDKEKVKRIRDVLMNK